MAKNVYSQIFFCKDDTLLAKQRRYHESLHQAFLFARYKLEEMGSCFYIVITFTLNNEIHTKLITYETK